MLELYQSRWSLINFVGQQVESRLAEMCAKRRMPRYSAKDVEEIMPDGVPLVPLADVEDVLDNLDELQQAVNEYMDAVRRYSTRYEMQHQDGLHDYDYARRHGGKTPLCKPFRDIH